MRKRSRKRQKGGREFEGKETEEMDYGYNERWKG